MPVPKPLSALLIAVFLVAGAGCASTEKQQGTAEYVQDSALAAKVKAALFSEPSINPGEIRVDAFDGIAQLSGFVSSKESIEKALQIARGVEGVASVKNDMRLK